MKKGATIRFKKLSLTGTVTEVKPDGRYEVQCNEYPIAITAENGEIEHFDDTLAGQIWQSWGGRK